ncbi:MAG: hypothetical protein KBD05_00380 [Candidatus Pacebacteria bacterium]|nr:hypothetical protein [Candidatus Paceibacterota bacterium]
MPLFEGEGARFEREAAAAAKLQAEEEAQGKSMLEGNGLVIGQSGAMMVFHDQEGKKVGGEYHSVRFDTKLNELIGQVGATVYVLDPKTGSPISNNYGSLRAKKNLRGKTEYLEGWNRRYKMWESVQRSTPEEGLRRFEEERDRKMERSPRN